MLPARLGADGIVARVARVAVLLTVLVTPGVLWTGHKASARVDELMTTFGSQMMHYGRATRHDRPRGMWVNGQRVMLTMASTQDDVKTVLDYFGDRCAVRDGQFGEYAASTGRVRSTMTSSPKKGMATLRDATENQGYVACLDVGPKPLSPAEVLRRVERFSLSGNVGDVGQLRYVYASRKGNTTTVIALWTDHGLKIDALFPEASDSPGRDVANVPRPPSARRVLSAWEEGYPQSITVYTSSSLNAEGLRAHYNRVLPGEGWLVTHDGQAPARARKAEAIVAERNGRTIALVFDTDPETGRGTTTVLASR